VPEPPYCYASTPTGHDCTSLASTEQADRFEATSINQQRPWLHRASRIIGSCPLQQTDPEPSPHLPLTGPHRITLAQDPRLRHRQEAPAVRPTPHASPPPGDSCPAQPNLSQGRPAQSGSPSWCQWNGMTWVAWSDIAPPLGRRSAIIFSPFILALVLASARMCRPHPTTKCLHHYGALSLLRGQETLWVNGSPRPSRTGRVTAGHMDLSADGSRHSLTSIV
jgi:hypothetical protein